MPETPVGPRVLMTFASKTPYHTNWLEIEAPADAEPIELYAALGAISWNEGQTYAALPPYPKFDLETMTDLGYQVQERHFARPGSAPFGGWTADERKAFMTEARAVLRHFGFTNVPLWRKTWQDML